MVLMVENQSKICGYHDGEWIKLLGLSVLRDGFLCPSHCVEIQSVPLPGRRIIWTQFYAALVFSLGCRPVPIVVLEGECQRGVSFGECIVNRQRMGCSFLRLRK